MVPLLQTHRLTLRPLNISDAPALFKRETIRK